MRRSRIEMRWNCCADGDWWHARQRDRCCNGGRTVLSDLHLRERRVHLHRRIRSGRLGCRLLWSIAQGSWIVGSAWWLSKWIEWCLLVHEGLLRWRRSNLIASKIWYWWWRRNGAELLRWIHLRRWWLLGVVVLLLVLILVKRFEEAGWRIRRRYRSEKLCYIGCSVRSLYRWLMCLCLRWWWWMLMSNVGLKRSRKLLLLLIRLGLLGFKWIYRHLRYVRTENRINGLRFRHHAGYNRSGTGGRCWRYIAG